MARKDIKCDFYLSVSFKLRLLRKNQIEIQIVWKMDPNYLAISKISRYQITDSIVYLNVAAVVYQLFWGLSRT